MFGSIPSPSTDRLELGPLTFRFYGLMIALGVLAAVEIGRRRWAAHGGDPDDVIEVAKWAVPAGLIGTRIYHVATDWKTYQGDWLRAFEIWNGGLGIPGGLLAGVLTGIWYVRRRGWSLPDMVSSVIPGIPVAQAIGRLGNWFNQEIFGRPTDVPWALEIEERFRPAEFADEPTFHPTFLYEALWNLGLAYLLIRLDRAGKLKPWQMLPLWIAGYGVGRFVVEGMRTDTASLILGIRVNHWVSGIAVFVGIVWFWWLGRRPEATDDEMAAEPNDDDEADTDVESSDDESADGGSADGDLVDDDLVEAEDQA